MSATFDEQLALADVYAAALFELATEAGQVEPVRQELEELARLAETDPGFANFLSSGAVDAEQRRQSLERMFRGRLSDVVLNTLQVMSAHGRAHMLAPLLRAYVLRVERAAGQVEVRVTSAVELSAEQQEQARRLAAELSRRKPLVEFTVDAGLLGGLVLQIGDYRYDNSLRRHLRATRRQLHERAELGIPAGMNRE